MGSRAQTHRSMSRSYRVDVSQELGRSFKSQQGPNGLFRPPTEPRPPPQKPPQAMTARSRFRPSLTRSKPHSTEDPRYYGTQMLPQQSLSKFSPGPQYNCQPDWDEPCTVFSPRAPHSYPRDELISTGTITFAGGPRMPSLMRTRKAYKSMSTQHEAADRTFPTRDINKLEPGPFMGHVSTFGKDKYGTSDHAAVQSTFAAGPGVSFAPPFSAPPAKLEHRWTCKRTGLGSPRLRLVGQHSGNEVEEKYPALPRVRTPRNSLFPYTNRDMLNMR